MKEKNNTPYQQALRAELKALRAKHGFEYDGGEDGPRWVSKVGVKSSERERMAKLMRQLDMCRNGNASAVVEYRFEVFANSRNTVRRDYLVALNREAKYQPTLHAKRMSES